MAVERSLENNEERSDRLQQNQQRIASHRASESEEDRVSRLATDQHRHRSARTSESGKERNLLVSPFFMENLTYQTFQTTIIWTIM